MSRINLTMYIVMAIAIVALVVAVSSPSAAYADSPPITTYKVEMTRIVGDRSSEAGVEAADKVPVNAGNPCDDITVTVAVSIRPDSMILAAADAQSNCHSINTRSRYIDTRGDVHNFQSGARTYWRITRQATPPPTLYRVEMISIDGDRSSVAEVKAADRVPVNPGHPCDDITVRVPTGSPDGVILAAADRQSNCHRINNSSRYIDADDDVHNFQSGASTYWLITKFNACHAASK